MKVEFRKSFETDLKNIRDQALLKRIRKLIEEVERATSLTEIPNLKKLKGRSDYYRVRLGDHRVGIAVVRNCVTFVRCLGRKDIYRYFP